MRTFLILSAILFALITPVAVFAGSQLIRNAQQESQLAAVRQATEKYHDVNAAIADGYIPAESCVASPDGGMGYHYINPQLASDLTTDPLRPELLLYAPAGNGVKLVGVEYFQADAGQERPMVLGQPFHGPMPGHEPGMPTHYDLHVWIWQANPNGISAPWNPQIHC